MKSRCYNSNAPNYQWYGGKGVKLCKEWKDSYEAFKKWAMSNGYQDGLTIDRLDAGRNYSPVNCQWLPFEYNVAKMAASHRRLTFTQAEEIRASGLSQYKLAEKYGVPRPNIARIIRFETYKKDYENG